MIRGPEIKCPKITTVLGKWRFSKKKKKIKKNS